MLLRQIAENAGEDGGDLRQGPRQGRLAPGLRCAVREFKDMVKAGIIDLTKVVRSGIVHAASRRFSDDHDRGRSGAPGKSHAGNGSSGGTHDGEIAEKNGRPSCCTSRPLSPWENLMADQDAPIRSSTR